MEILSGHFPWLLKMLWGIISYSEVGKTMNYVAKVARDLIKARRESGHTEKVPLSGVCLHRAQQGVFPPPPSQNKIYRKLIEIHT